MNMYRILNLNALTSICWDSEIGNIVCFNDTPNKDEVFGVTRMNDKNNGDRVFLIGLYGGGATEKTVEAACYQELHDALGHELDNPSACIYILDEEEKIRTNSQIIEETEYTVAFKVNGRIHIPVRGVSSPEEAAIVAEEICNGADFGELEDIEYEIRWIEDPNGKRTEA